jgi:hypothetical protein
MAIDNDKIIWTTDKQGLVLDEYNGNYSIKSMTKWTTRSGVENISPDWVHRKQWNKETKAMVLPEKANMVSGVYLGDREKAIDALHSLLIMLGSPEAEETSSEPPF